MRPMSIHILNATFATVFLNFVFACTVQFTCTVHANSANSLALSRTVQVNCTVHSNSASKLHCSGDFYFYFYFIFIFLVCIVFVYIFFLKKN